MTNAPFTRGAEWEKGSVERAVENSTLVLVQRFVAAYMQHNVAPRAARDLTVNEDLVLIHLVVAPATSAELCRRIGITSASMTRIVAGLEERGLLRRLPDPNDGRRVLLYASKATLARADDPVLERRVEALLRGMDETERQAVETFLERAIDDFGRPDEDSSNP